MWVSSSWFARGIRVLSFPTGGFFSCPSGTPGTLRDQSLCSSLSFLELYDLRDFVDLFSWDSALPLVLLSSRHFRDSVDLVSRRSCLSFGPLVLRGLQGLWDIGVHNPNLITFKIRQISKFLFMNSCLDVTRFVICATLVWVSRICSESAVKKTKILETPSFDHNISLMPCQIGQMSCFLFINQFARHNTIYPQRGRNPLFLFRKPNR